MSSFREEAWELEGMQDTEGGKKGLDGSMDFDMCNKYLCYQRLLCDTSMLFDMWVDVIRSHMPFCQR